MRITLLNQVYERIQNCDLREMILANLQLKSLCSRSFDTQILKKNVSNDVIDKVCQTLKFFLNKEYQNHPNIQQMLKEQKNLFNRNFLIVLTTINQHLTQTQTKIPTNYQDLLTHFTLDYVNQFISNNVEELNEIIMQSLMKDQSYLIVNDQAQLIVQTVVDNLNDLILKDTELLKQHNQSRLNQGYLLFALLLKVTTSSTLLGCGQQSQPSGSQKQLSELMLSQGNLQSQNVKASLIEQLNQYIFIFMQKALTFYEIGTVPIYYEYLLNLQKVSKKQPCQLDMFMKNKLQKYFKDIFEVIARNIEKTSLWQVGEFCKNLQWLKTVGFEVLSQINFFLSLQDIHYKLNSYMLKVKDQILQIENLEEATDLRNEYFLLEQKLAYMINQIEILFVDSFQDENQKSVQDKRIHQIVQLWNTYFEHKQDNFLKNVVDTEGYSDYFEKSSLFKQIKTTNKSEEIYIKKLSFLQVSNRFLLKDKERGESFSSQVITELVFPKFDLSNQLQQLFSSQQERVSQLVFEKLVKNLYKFFFNLMANTKELSLREKALKDMSKSLSLLFNSRDNLLDYVAEKIEQNYFQLQGDEQMAFLIEVLSVITQQFLKIEEDFFVSVEASRGSVESMRQHSIFRQFVQKAQKSQKMQIGSILEKKIIDCKKVFCMLPLLTKCAENVADNMLLKSKTASLMLELWIFLILNNPFFMVPETKQQKSQNKISVDETKELNVVLQPFKDYYQQMAGVLNQLAFSTPNLLPGNLLTFLDSRIITVLIDHKNTYTCHNFYMRCLTQQVKTLFGLKKKTFQSKLNIQELLYIIILNEVFQRSFEWIETDICRLQKESFVNKFVSYLKAPMLTLVNAQSDQSDLGDEIMQEEVDSIHNMHKQLLQNLKQIKSYYFIQETITRTTLRYSDFLIKQKGSGTKEIIAQDFVYLIQMSCSIEKKLSEYTQELLVDFIRYFPFACFSPQVMMTFSEAITFLYQKIGREFESRSFMMQSKTMKCNVYLPTDCKLLTKMIVFLMNSVQKLIFRGLYIDHNFQKVLLLHLIKQETTLMSELPFGYRFLKFVITSFRIDKEAIEAFKHEADRYNPYFWMTREVEFDSKIGQSDLTQFVSDKGLIRLQKLELSHRINQNTAQEILKIVDNSIKNEIELEFQLDEKYQMSLGIEKYKLIMNNISQYCQEINLCQYFQINKHIINQKMLNMIQQNVNEELKSLILNSSQNDSQFQQQLKLIKKKLINQMLSQVASLKSVLTSQIKSQLLSSLLDISKQYLQPQLLKYTLMRLIPFLHSISPNYFDSTFFFILGEMLNYVVYQINTLGNLKYDKKISAQDVFQIRSNYFNPLIEFEISEFNTTQNLVCMAQIGYFEQRWRSLCKIHYILIKFLNDNMQIHLVKNVKLSVIANILKLNFLTDKKLVEFLPLENVSQVLKGCIEILQLMKEFKEKLSKQDDILEHAQNLHPYKSSSNQTNLIFDVEYFYYKTLKFGLSHFAKNQNFYIEPLFQQCQNLQKLKKKFNLYAIVCKYLSKDKLHELNEESRINRLKRAKKRFNAVVFKAHRNQLLSFDKPKNQSRASLVLDNQYNGTKVQVDISFKQQQVFTMNYSQGQSSSSAIRPYYLRKALLLMICDEMDKIKAFAYSKLADSLSSEFSLLTQNKISENFLNQILAEIPEKNLNLAYYIIIKLYPLLQRNEPLDVLLTKLLGERITHNCLSYLDCQHFFDIYVNHNLFKTDKSYVNQLIYWKPPHIQLLLKYVTSSYEDYPEIQLCFVKIMKRLHSEQIIFYLPQIVQSLGSRQGQLIKSFLIEFAFQSVLFSHQLIWLAKVEAKIDPDHKRPPSPKNLPDNFDVLQSNDYKEQVELMIRRGEVPQNQLLISKIAPKIIQKALMQMDTEKSSFFRKLDGFFEKVTAISGILRPQQSKAEKREIIARELAKIEVTPDIYMPSNPRFQLASIKLDSGAPMQSAAKCPILVSFFCRKFEGPDKYFEKKLKAKKELMKSFETKEIDEWDLVEDDDLSGEEDKGPLFINELVRPVVSRSLRQSQQQSQQSIIVDRSKQRRMSASDRIQEFRLQKQESMKKFEQQQNQQLSILELKSCIFKVFDDIRQDNLALQIIQMFKGIFDRTGLDLAVFPYKAISNRTGRMMNVGGIIEVVPNTISRDQMGKTNRCSLYEYFLNKFGLPEQESFQVARENFIKSQAAYSIISYILQIKDRHNGNILISDKGSLIHIDFGFIFDISPGHNMRFESANFKLTKEMIQIMGGSADSEPFKYYMDLTIRAYLAVRKYYEHMFNLVRLMLDSGLKCFRKDSLKLFTERFQLKRNDLAASKYMKEVIMDAYDKMTTRLYDDIQYMQNGIAR